ncbi:hypothetical protein [Bradyrhizobium sp. USDA 4454]
MSEGWLNVIFFVCFAFGCALSIRAGINAATRKIGRWDHNSTQTFLGSMGDFGNSRLKFLQQNGAYNEAEARIVAEYQTWALLGCFASLFGGALVDVAIGSLLGVQFK